MGVLMANQGTQVSGALGTAQQFMPNAPQTYQQNLANVAPAGNPMARFTNGSDMLATGLSQLGVAWRQYTNDTEERKEKIAKAIAPQVLSSLTEDQKFGLNTRQILMTSGKYNLQDNEYAVATIDRMRGTEVGKRIESDWKIYDDQHKMQPDLPRQFNTFDEFYEERLKGYMGEENIDNQFAFQSGLEEQHIATKMAVYDTFTQKKEQKLKLERVNGITAMVGGWARNNPNITLEEAQPYLESFIGHIKETATSDSQLEYKLLSNVLDSISKTGSVELVDAFGDLEYDPETGKRVRDIVDISGFKDGANTTATQIRNDRFVAITKELQGLSTVAQLDDYFSKKAEENQEDYRMIAPLYNSYKSHIEAKQREEARRAKLEEALKRNQSNAVAVTDPLLNAMASGAVDYQFNGQRMAFPRSESDLKTLGIDKDMFITRARQMVDQKITTGDVEGLQFLLANPLISENMRNQFKDQLDVGFASMNQSGNVPEVVELAMKVYRARPAMVNQLLPKEWVGRIQALGALQDTRGITEGTQIFATGMQNLRNPDVADRVEKAVKEVSLGSASVLSIRKGTWDSVYINENTNGALGSIIRQEAQILMATGTFNEREAVEFAKQSVSKSYLAYDNILIPREPTLSKTGVSSEAFASEGLRHTLDTLKEAHGGSEATVTYDPDQQLIYIRRVGSYEGDAYSLDDIGYRSWTYLSSTTADERKPQAEVLDYTYLADTLT